MPRRLVLPLFVALLSLGAVRADDGTVERLDLDALRDKVVVLEVMETWCGVCRRAIPTLNAWHDANAARGLYVVAASPESADALARYRRAHGFAAHLAVDEGGAVARRFEASAFPTFIVLDRAGEVRGRVRGWDAEAARHLEALFTSLLGGPADPDGIRF